MCVAVVSLTVASTDSCEHVDQSDAFLILCSGYVGCPVFTACTGGGLL